jgi:hypothetical protein
METLSQYFFWRPVFVHELNSHTYSPLSFLLASPLTLLPWVGSAYLLFLLLSFLMADIPTPFFPSFLLPLLLIYLVLLTTYFLTLGLCARLKRPELAYVLTPITFVIMGSLTGLSLPPSLPPSISLLSFRFAVYPELPSESKFQNFNFRISHGRVFPFLQVSWSSPPRPPSYGSRSNVFSTLAGLTAAWSSSSSPPVRTRRPF